MQLLLTVLSYAAATDPSPVVHTQYLPTDKMPVSSHLKTEHLCGAGDIVRPLFVLHGKKHGIPLPAKTPGRILSTGEQGSIMNRPQTGTGRRGIHQSCRCDSSCDGGCYFVDFIDERARDGCICKKIVTGQKCMTIADNARPLLLTGRRPQHLLQRTSSSGGLLSKNTLVATHSYDEL